MAVLGAAAANAGGGSPFPGKWRIVAVRSVDSFDASKTLFEAGPDGRVSTTVGCNRMVGSPVVEGQRIAFGAMAATRMACPPPLDALETKYAAALAAARSFRRDGTKLVILDGAGDPAITLERVD